MRNKTFHFLLFFPLFLFVLSSFAQVPEDLTSSRSVVIIDVPDQDVKGFKVRADWKKLARTAHGGLKQIGVDAILYLNRDDLKAGPEITLVYENVLMNRRVSNLILIQEVGEGYEKAYKLKIFDKVQGIALYDPYYSITAPGMEELMLLLGRQVLRQGVSRSNLLILDQPEYLDNLSLFSGTRFVNVSSRLKSQTLAVILFDTITAPSGLSEQDLVEIKNENVLIRQQNAELANIMQRYPLKYELVYFKGIEDLYRKGFQYVLLPVISTGKTIKKMLDYETSDAETMYVSETQHLNDKPVLKKIPVQAVQAKYYIKQTIVNDIHVGKRWDADVSWQQALNNFLDNIFFDLQLEN
ncbi:hypothetical protein [Marinoscillum sp. MHG1-6]|uniref:hypothetical protein n=1 Tax=Marinoscillum sp. MHG1-6 TaxID=2959627 RepID=UPI002156FF83|nr:hypothetical protein [Marinoscillum sp. MHG1-6]